MLLLLGSAQTRDSSNAIPKQTMVWMPPVKGTSFLKKSRSHSFTVRLSYCGKILLISDQRIQIKPENTFHAEWNSLSNWESRALGAQTSNEILAKTDDTPDSPLVDYQNHVALFLHLPHIKTKTQLDRPSYSFGTIEHCCRPSPYTECLRTREPSEITNLIEIPIGRGSAGVSQL